MSTHIHMYADETMNKQITQQENNHLIVTYPRQNWKFILKYKYSTQLTQLNDKHCKDPKFNRAGIGGGTGGGGSCIYTTNYTSGMGQN